MEPPFNDICEYKIPNKRTIRWFSPPRATQFWLSCLLGLLFNLAMSCQGGNVYWIGGADGSWSSLTINSNGAWKPNGTVKFGTVTLNNGNCGILPRGMNDFGSFSPAYHRRCTLNGEPTSLWTIQSQHGSLAGFKQRHLDNAWADLHTHWQWRHWAECLVRNKWGGGFYISKSDALGDNVQEMKDRSTWAGFA